MIIPSVFLTEDPKRHMSINLDSGLWQCFKTSEKGNFLKLYAILENLSYRKAYEKFLVEEFFAEEEFKVIKEDHRKGQASQDISQEMDTNWEELGVEHQFLLSGRGYVSDVFKFYYAKSGDYKGRLIIPYFNLGSTRPFYFQARAIDSNTHPKYLNFKGIKSSSILFPFNYQSEKPLYICEGAFDAMALQCLGINATTTISCHVSKEQISQLKHYQGPIVVAYDNDKAGRDGLRSFEMQRRKGRLPPINYIFPPQEYKDWSEFYARCPSHICHYVLGYKKFTLNEWDTMKELSTLDQ